MISVADYQRGLAPRPRVFFSRDERKRRRRPRHASAQPESAGRRGLPGPRVRSGVARERGARGRRARAQVRKERRRRARPRHRPGDGQEEAEAPSPARLFFLAPDACARGRYIHIPLERLRLDSGQRAGGVSEPEAMLAALAVAPSAKFDQIAKFVDAAKLPGCSALRALGFKFRSRPVRGPRARPVARAPSPRRAQVAVYGRQFPPPRVLMKSRPDARLTECKGRRPASATRAGARATRGPAAGKRGAGEWIAQRAWPFVNTNAIKSWVPTRRRLFSFLASRRASRARRSSSTPAAAARGTSTSTSASSATRSSRAASPSRARRPTPTPRRPTPTPG